MGQKLRKGDSWMPGFRYRALLVRDPDGYEWAVGVLIPPAKGPLGPTG
jgi:hypothetical protein